MMDSDQNQKEQLDKFDQHLENLKGMRASSRSRYRKHVSEFLKWHAENAPDGHSTKITGTDVERYLDHCRKRGNGNQTRSTKFAAIQSFCRFLIFSRSSQITSDPFTHLRRPAAQNDPLHRFTSNEILRMFSVCDIASSEKCLRDAVFLIMGVFVGLRLDELIRFNVDHLSDDGVCVDFNVIKSKKDGNRTVRLWKDPSAVVRSLLGARLTQGARRGDPLLVSYKKNGQPRGNRRLTPCACDGLIKKLAQYAGVQKPVVKTHMLRTSHVFDMQRVIGFDTRQIMTRLGWTTLEPFARYFPGEKIPQEYESLEQYWDGFSKLSITRGNADRGGDLIDK